MKYFLTQTFIRQNALLAGFAVTTGVLHLLCNLVLLLSIGCYIELLFHAGSSKSRALLWMGIDLPQNLPSFFTLFFGAAVIKFLCSFLEKYTTSRAGMLYAAKARKEYFQYLLHSPETLKVKSPARQLVWFSSELKSMQRYMEKGMIGFTRDMIYFFFCCYLLLQFHVILGAVIAASIPLLWLLSKWGHYRLKTVMQTGRNAIAGLLSFISRRLHQIENKQATTNTYKTTTRFIQRQQKAIKLQQEMLTGKALLHSMVPAVLYCLLGLLLFLIANPAFITISSADAVGFILLLINLFSVIRRVVKIESIRLPGRISLEKMEKAHQELLHCPPNLPFFFEKELITSKTITNV
ncbi:ABC transporter transmembrane domain-containing protein [Lacibacter sp. MH-610]|uniref:ABC transporter transmembrane domain-containing protein n=1 Tax=Lacibacter sp. MH-610 TaxID=3020883 RepID=UPI00389241C1